MTRRHALLALAVGNFAALGACAAIASSTSSTALEIAFVGLAWLASGAFGLSLGLWAASS